MSKDLSALNTTQAEYRGFRTDCTCVHTRKNTYWEITNKIRQIMLVDKHRY